MLKCRLNFKIANYLLESEHIMGKNLRHSLENLVLRMKSGPNSDPERFYINYEPDWPSVCYCDNVAAGERVAWQPELMDQDVSFANIESALEIKLNPQFCQFFSVFWSFNLPVNAPDGACELLQVSNREDLNNLQQNLIGHLLMKQRLNQPPTLFFGLTDEDDFILCVDNSSGEVVLEQVGKLPSRTLAPDLSTFIDSLH